MREIKIDLNKITKKQIDLIADYLLKGKVIVYPTDTIYGLGCLATDEKAIERIYKIKQRDKSKPLLILASSFNMVKKYCFLSTEQEKFLKNKWSACAKATAGKPWPVSVILKSKNLLPRELTGGKNSIAVRLPKNKFLIKIIKGVGKPIVSTSVNISGRKSLTNVDNTEKYFGAEKPDLIVDAGELKAKPSRLIDIRDAGHIKALRN